MSDAPSPRVLIRPVQRRDVGEFLERVRASAELHGPWILPPRTVGEFTAFVDSLDGRTAVAFLVCLRGTGAAAGYVKISQIMADPYHRGVLGFGAFVPYQGKGYMTEGLELVIRHALGAMRLHRLEADIEPGNQPSRNLAKRLGFRLEGLSPAFIRVSGVWRDFERWAITAPDRATQG